jgi:KEOPS complex subunit Cgi121
MIKIVGAKGDIRDVDVFLKEILGFSKKYGVVIQVLNADLIYGENHLVSAVEHTQRAFERRRNSTNSFAMEILLYASGERQIHKGIEKIGVKEGKSNIAFVFVDKIENWAPGTISDDTIEETLAALNLTRDDEVLKGNVDTLKRFGITQQELTTVPQDKQGDLILEKVAMVDVIK